MVEINELALKDVVPKVLVSTRPGRPKTNVDTNVSHLLKKDLKVILDLKHSAEHITDAVAKVG